MSKRFKIALGLTFFIYIASFFVLQLIIKDIDFSELENRNLSSLPTLSADRLLDGTFEKEFETYVADQFPLRNQFISVKANAERLLLKKENNGVYLGKDGYLLQDFKEPNLELAERNAGYISSLTDKFNVYMALAPTATSILSHKLPAFASPYSELSFIDLVESKLSPAVHKVPIDAVLTAHKNEYIYYKTDHHWTTLGAYYAYTAFCETAGLTPIPLDDFNIETVPDGFYGSLFSKGNFTFIKPDTLQLFYPKNEIPVTVTYEASETVTDTLYAYDYLKKKDKYSVFLDNNHPLITIKTATHNGKKIMIVKDSYANSFVPFLTAHYEEIHILDLRMLSIPVRTYAIEHQIDDVLILYNVQNFSGEGKLSLLKK